MPNVVKKHSISSELAQKMVDKAVAITACTKPRSDRRCALPRAEHARNGLRADRAARPRRLRQASGASADAGDRRRDVVTRRGSGRRVSSRSLRLVTSPRYVTIGDNPSGSAATMSFRLS